MTYNDLNIHPRDAHLSFDPDTHSYHFDGREMTSVTTLVEDCFPKFDKNYWAARKALQEGVDPDMILDRWDREAQHARDLGTMMHAGCSGCSLQTTACILTVQNGEYITKILISQALLTS